MLKRSQAQLDLLDQDRYGETQLLSEVYRLM